MGEIKVASCVVRLAVVAATSASRPAARSPAYIGNFEQGYIAMGYIIIASSVFTIFMRIKGQSSVLCGDQ